MKVVGLDGKAYKLNLVGHVPLMDYERQTSHLHQRARSLLNEMFPLERILEEVVLPGTGGLSADFFVPMKKLVIEVQGQQHYKFIQHFHKSETDFKKSIQRDENKMQWCKLNNICLVSLPYSETDDEWKLRIGGR